MPSRDIILQPGCFLGVVASAIEAYNRETNGFLMGNPKTRGRARRVSVLEAAYPIQTETRMPSWVSHGNLSAFDRARSTVNQLDVGLELVGGYHSHPGPGGTPSLSNLDLAYIQDEVHGMNRGRASAHRGHSWLELIVAIRKKEYGRPHALRWTWREYGRKIGAIVPLSEAMGFDTTMAAYWVTTEPDGNGRPPEIREVKEARLRIPWTPRST
jgi:proteasome lid subunit RPN8/RPN11